MSRPVVRASLLAAGVLLVQLAWILTVPPFRGIDEFDHAYRAAAVAHGQWLPRASASVRGHGEYVEVASGAARYNPVFYWLA